MMIDLAEYVGVRQWGGGKVHALLRACGQWVYDPRECVASWSAKLFPANACDRLSQHYPAGVLHRCSMICGFQTGIIRHADCAAAT